MTLAVRGGLIVEIAPGLDAPAHEVNNARGLLLSPPFADAHFHMDACLSYGLPRVNQGGTLLEGSAVWGELKPLLSREALIDRALSYCAWAVAKGRHDSDYMLEAAHMGLHVAHITSQKGIRDCFNAVTTGAAKVMHLQGYGLEVGCDASFAAAGAGRGGGDPVAGESAEGLEEGQAAGGDAGGGGKLDRRQPTHQDRLLQTRLRTPGFYREGHASQGTGNTMSTRPPPRAPRESFSSPW